jgi:RNA 2',3'-cyclic 3'-phosphodiesterase
LRGLRAGLPEASWTRPESWHLTLYFLGEISEAQAARFSAELGPRAAKAPEGDLLATGAVVFPPRGAARVLGVGFAATPFTAALGELAGAAARLAPITRDPKHETRNFHPHVTFARIRRPWPPADVDRYRSALGEWPSPAWRVRACVLYRSRLDPGGAVHTPIRTWSFASAAAGAPA